jgi:phage tail-like protein
VSAEPFTAFSFAVEIRPASGGGPLCQAAFAECEGLELRRELVEYRTLEDPERVHLVAGRESVGTVTLRRGMTSSFDLWDWWEQVRRDPGGARATCDIVVLSPDLTQERVRFRLHRGLPLKLTGPRLNAATSEVAIETLEIAGEGLEVVRPGSRPSPGLGPLVKAQLRELDSLLQKEVNKTRWVSLQLNPDALCTTLSHEDGPRSQLALSLRFDVRVPAPGRRAPDDVRRLTERVAYFATPRRGRGGEDVRPGVRLAWGTFRFDGFVETFEESLEEFSPDGRPLSASLALTLARDEIVPYAFG